jgi:hypothetical protein
MRGNDVFSDSRLENGFMRPKLILTIVLAAALLLVSTEVGSAAKKVSIKADKAQTAVIKPAQPQVPETQPETATVLSPSGAVVPPGSETEAPTNVNASPKAGEQINWQVLASGGGTQTLGTLVLGSTIGQTAAGTSSVGSYTLQSGFWQNFGGDYLCGDADRSGDINIADVVYLVAYIFSGGPAPDPLASGDADCDGVAIISDAVYLVAYIFSGGPAPCAACK